MLTRIERNSFSLLKIGFKGRWHFRRASAKTLTRLQRGATTALRSGLLFRAHLCPFAVNPKIARGGMVPEPLLRER